MGAPSTDHVVEVSVASRHRNSVRIASTLASRLFGGSVAHDVEESGYEGRLASWFGKSISNQRWPRAPKAKPQVPGRAQGVNWMEKLEYEDAKLEYEDPKRLDSVYP